MRVPVRVPAGGPACCADAERREARLRWEREEEEARARLALREQNLRELEERLRAGQEKELELPRYEPGAMPGGIPGVPNMTGGITSRVRVST